MAVNAVLLLAAVALLILAPFHLSVPTTDAQAEVLLGGVATLIAVDLLLVWRAMGPLEHLVDAMRSVDPRAPGRRLPAGRGEVAELSAAFNAMLDRLEGERRESARRALAAQERERLRVARELHDEVGQGITASLLALEQAGGDPARLERAAGELRRTLEEVRRIARELRPEALDELGLVNALIALCARAGESDVRVRRDLRAPPPLHPDAELAIYRVAQEALTNALRHARPGEVAVTLRATDARVELEVRDDGAGLALPVRAGGGITGMRERARLVGGEVDVLPAPSGGTVVRLTVPV